MSAIVTFGLMFGLYVLFAGAVSSHELSTAAVLAVLATAWSYVIRGNSTQRFLAGGEAARHAARAVGALVPATVRAGRILLGVAIRGGSPGRAFVTRFRQGGSDDPHDETRRAVAVLGASLAPDRFVISAERGTEALLHSVDPVRREADERWLE